MESIADMINNIKEEMLSSSLDPGSFISPSAYDTAWLAMIPDQSQPDRPMFPRCLDWIMESQGEQGFWGELGHDGEPTVECLSTSLACMAALSSWSMGPCNVDKGLAFVNANAERLIREQDGDSLRWFCIVFPAMVELAQNKGLQVFPRGMTTVITSVFSQRQRILQMEQFGGEVCDPPLFSFIEALPPSYYNKDHEKILQSQSKDGSLFQSPSATAYAFMVTRSKDCKLYLESLVQRCGPGVPSLYFVDKEFVKLCMINHLERLGLSEHFSKEIEDSLCHIYRKWKMDEVWEDRKEGRRLVPFQIYKDSLAFRLLRLHGYRVSPKRFCWFLQDEDIKSYMQENHDQMLSAMLSVHRAADVMFSGDHELEEAKSFSTTILQRGLGLSNSKDSVVTFNNQSEIENELGLPWLARLDHLEHRLYIEQSHANNYLWKGKASYYRLSFLNNKKLLQLAKENYTLRQSIFIKEIEELRRWCKNYGLLDMGFGRENSMCCYFSIGSSAYHSYLADIRMLVAKSAILVTVADDFFDMGGSLDELSLLIKAIERWDGAELYGHSKVIFDALNDLADDTIKMFWDQYQIDAMKSIRGLWHGTFLSWLKEATWSRTNYAPSIDEYIETSTISIAVHTMILPASYLMSPALVRRGTHYPHADSVTRLAMVLARLLNDTQSFEKELKDGKINLILLKMRKNPELDIQESIAETQAIINKKKKEFLKLALEDASSGLPKPYRDLHLWSLKAFQMFFNVTNRFDSPTAMVDDINKAFYKPPMLEETRTAAKSVMLDLLEETRLDATILKLDEAKTTTKHREELVRHKSMGNGKVCKFGPFKAQTSVNCVVPIKAPMIFPWTRIPIKVLKPHSTAKPLFW